MPPTLYGFHGPSKSGKDTCASLLKTDRTLALAFATPLKSAASDLLGFTHEQMHDDKLKDVVDPRWGRTPRSALLWLGDAARKEFGEDVLVARMRERLSALLTDTSVDMVFVTDVRMQPEAELIKELGGVVVRVCRWRGAEESAHATERALPAHLVDYYVDNNGTLDELKGSLVSLVEEVVNTL